MDRGGDVQGDSMEEDAKSDKGSDPCGISPPVRIRDVNISRDHDMRMQSPPNPPAATTSSHHEFVRPSLVRNSSAGHLASATIKGSKTQSDII